MSSKYEGPLVYLCDLSHTGQGFGSEMVPLGIGYLKAYADRMLPCPVDIRLFKDPAKLDAAFRDQVPIVAAFSNYLWNHNLSSRFAQRIKERYPDVLTVFGGPNYPLDPNDRSRWHEAHPWVDCYLRGEGEHPFFRYLQYAMDPFATGKNGPPRFTYITPEAVPDLDVIPSPYLNGSLDEFLADTRLTPMMETTRGCPFTCTFCVDGANHEKVRRFDLDRMLDEARYIASMTKSKSLMLTDANFGMYEDDVAFAEGLAKVKEDTGWPQYIIASTGKNNKERVIKVARILRGSLRVAASLQSTDSGVLEKVQRQNIATSELEEMALALAEDGSNTYAEFILGLPGDTRTKHTRGVMQAVDLGFNQIRMHQLTLLPGSEMDTPKQRAAHGFHTMHRILQRSFGRYSFLGDSMDIIETEEVVTQHGSMSWNDYIYCRTFALTVALFYNERVFGEVQDHVQHLGLKYSDFLLALHGWIMEDVAIGAPDVITVVYSRFISAAHEELCPTLEALAIRESTPAMHLMDDLLIGRDGNNLLFNTQGRVMYQSFSALNQRLFSYLVKWLDPAGPERSYLGALECYLHYKKGWLHSLERVDEVLFQDYDFAAFEAGDGFKHGMKPMGMTALRFAYDQAQIDFWRHQLATYTDSDQGLGKMIARCPMKYGYRRVTRV